MGQTHNVQPGDYMELIAKQYGFVDYKTIYDNANNTAFKTARPNPDILLPGDKVYIPDKNPADDPAEVDKKHKYVLKAPSKVTLDVYLRQGTETHR
jgi:hypothetical protein